VIVITPPGKSFATSVCGEPAVKTNSPDSKSMIERLLLK
jgi:hypothetical protein